MRTHWQFDAAFDQYTFDFDQWRTQTQVNDARIAAAYIRHWHFDIPNAVAAWRRANST
jgi:hypothetical protein